MFSGRRCLVNKIMPDTDAGRAECSDHTSVGSFEQGIFTINSLDQSNYNTVMNWFSDHKDTIGSIDCFLLKHPLFEFPMEAYVFFQFVHHAQIGFKVNDKKGKTIRHFCLQLQNSWWPSVPGVPFDPARGCLLVDPKTLGNSTKEGFSYPRKSPQPSSSKSPQPSGPPPGRYKMSFADATAIFGAFLEDDDYASDAVIAMNEYTTFKGINLSYLNNLVNFKFFLDSYRFWRGTYTHSGTDPVDPDLMPTLSTSQIPICGKSKIDLPVPLSEYKKGYGGGPADGSLWVFDTFSPAYLSFDEGVIFNFATLEGESCVDSMMDLCDWTFRNFQCYDNVLQHANSYSRAYATISTSQLNMNWVNKLCLDDNFMQNTFGKLTLPAEWKKENAASTAWKYIRGYDKDGKNYNSSMDWRMSTMQWGNNVNSPLPETNPHVVTCKFFDAIFDLIAAGGSSSNLFQPYVPTEQTGQVYVDSATEKQNMANSTCTPILQNSNNYNCEIWSRYLITMIMNTEYLTRGGKTKITKFFDFDFPGKVTKDPTAYCGCSPEDTNYGVTDNLLRSYTAMWPVMLFDKTGNIDYQNGVALEDFNSLKELAADAKEYADQSMLFNYMLAGNLMTASEEGDNPVLKALAGMFTLPYVTDIFKKMMPDSGGTILAALKGLMWGLFLHLFLSVENVYVGGYAMRNAQCVNTASNTDPTKRYTANGHSFANDFEPIFDCQNRVYKFKIGGSTLAGQANKKLLLAILKWVVTDQMSGDLLNKWQDIKGGTDAWQTFTNDLSDAGSAIKNMVEDLAKAANPGKDTCGPAPVPPPDFKWNDPKTWGSNTDYQFQKLNYDACEMKASTDSIKYGFQALNEGAKAYGDVVGGILALIKNPKAIPIDLVNMVGNSVTNATNLIYRFLASSLGNFTTYCHQNYTFAPEMLFQVNTKQVGGPTKWSGLKSFIPNLNRGNRFCASVCGDCKLGELGKLETFDNNWSVQKYPGSFKITDPYHTITKKQQMQKENKGGFVAAIVSCIVVILAVVLTLYFINKKVKKSIR